MFAYAKQMLPLPALPEGNLHCCTAVLYRLLLRKEERAALLLNACRPSSVPFSQQIHIQWMLWVQEQVLIPKRDKCGGGVCVQAAHPAAAGVAARAEPRGGGCAGARGLPGMAARAGDCRGDGKVGADALREEPGGLAAALARPRALPHRCPGAPLFYVCVRHRQMGKMPLE